MKNSNFILGIVVTLLCFLDAVVMHPADPHHILTSHYCCSVCSLGIRDLWRPFGSDDYTGDSVLLIGEGNFSFSVSFEKILPQVQITATCYEPVVDPQTECQKFQNIEKLTQKGVRVILGVDGTKLHSHSILGNELFSKIIFNFPHVGGKMKISLNRKLLREFFENVSSVLMPGGSVIMSLCQGQGGTAADTTFRCWGNSWRVVEMAAHGDFILCDIDRFPSSLFVEYTSVGYRSRDQSFHTDNALVHVFQKAKPLPSLSNVELLSISMNFQSLENIHGAIMCESIYVQKYKNRAMAKDGSPIHYFNQTFNQMALTELGNSEFVRHLTETEIPLHVKNPDGKYICEHEGKTFSCSLRASLLDVVDYITSFVDSKISQTTFVFPGIIFNPLSHDFSLAPVSNHLLIISSSDIESICVRYVNHLLSRTGNKDWTCLPTSALREDSLSSQATLIQNLALDTSEPTRSKCIIGQTYHIRTPDGSNLLTACVIFLEKLAMQLFKVNDWREIWAANMTNDMLVPRSLYPRAFTLDVCFSNLNSSPYSEAAFEEALWGIGGDFIVKLSPCFNEFVSEEGWESRCYSITYQSFESALYKERARDLHAEVMRVICARLRYKLH